MRPLEEVSRVTADGSRVRGEYTALAVKVAVQLQNILHEPLHRHTCEVLQELSARIEAFPVSRRG